LGGPISSGTGASTEVLDALIAASDHLPVFADYYHIASHPSDAKFDGLVDVADLGIVGANFNGTEVSYVDGDANLDGSVDVADLGIVDANWNVAQAASFSQALSAAGLTPLVPEPATLFLLAMSALVVGRRRRA